MLLELTARYMPDMILGHYAGERGGDRGGDRTGDRAGVRGGDPRGLGIHQSGSHSNANDPRSMHFDDSNNNNDNNNSNSNNSSGGRGGGGTVGSGNSSGGNGMPMSTMTPTRMGPLQVRNTPPLISSPPLH